MILPNKNIRIERSLIGCGVIVLREIKDRDTVTSIWSRVHKKESLRNYELFILTLDYLFAIGAIEWEDGLLVRCKND